MRVAGGWLVRAAFADVSARGDVGGQRYSRGGGRPVWWAFWRRRRRGGSAAGPGSRVAADEGRQPARRPAPRDRDDTEPVTAAPAFSGATPDAGRCPLPHPPGADEGSTTPAPAPVLDRAGRAAGASLVSRLTACLTSGDAPAVRQALVEVQQSPPTVVHAAATVATAALADRLPALSGVTGPAAVEDEEEPGDLLHAYAQLLVSRTEPRRAALAPLTSCATLEQVARAAAVLAAAGPAAAAEGPPPTVPAGPPAVAAAALLLAQTVRDGGGAVAALDRELARLVEAAGAGPSSAGAG